MKIEYITWKNLIEKETGLGWNHEKNTIDAPNEWWEKKVMENSIVVKFRHGGIQNRTKLEIMFNKIVVLSANSWNPYFIEKTAIEAEENSEQVDTNCDEPIIDTRTEIQNEDSARTKRKGNNQEKGKESKVGTERAMQQELKRMVDVMETFSTSTATR